MKTLYVIMLLFFSIAINGQNISEEFGKIDKDEIELSQYPQDKDAEAVVIFDVGKSYFVRMNNSYDVVYERTTRIKVFSEAGIKWAEVEIPYYQEGGIYEKVYDIEANTYNYENGIIHKTPFNVSNTFDKKINNYWNVKKFALPNVKPGSIIEYRYSISSQYKFNLRDWEFQWKIPVIYSEYDVRMIPFYEYSWLLQGANKFSSQSSYIDKGISRQFGNVSFQDMVHKYTMQDVPAFDNEEFISSINDYIIKIDFQLAKINYPSGISVDIITTWEDMIQEMMKHMDFGKYVKKAEKITTNLIDKDALVNKTSAEKFNYVLEYVKSNFNWDQNNGKYASKSPKKLVEEKFGNCADLNLLTIGMLHSLGIEAYPVLISTRNHGKIKYNYPYAHFFNYVLILANIDGNKILTDATQILSLNYRIPERCINDKGLIIQKDKVEWVSLEYVQPSEINTNVHIEFPNTTEVCANITRLFNEYDALHYRNNFGNDIEAIKKNIDIKEYTMIDSSLSIKNQLEKDKPYILSYQLTGKPEIINEKLYVDPFVGISLSDNPLKQRNRTYPVDLTYPRKRSYKSIILIPEGYQTVFLPDQKIINNKLFELKYNVTSDAEKINISFEYLFKNAVYQPDDYSKIKFYFKEIVKKGNEKIVLSEITENIE